MEKFFYFGNVAAGNLSLAYPVENWRGAHPEDATTLHLYFTPMLEMGLSPDKDNDIMILTLSSDNKHKDVLESICEALNTSEDGVIVIVDIDSGEKINSYISAISVTMSRDV